MGLVSSLLYIQRVPGKSFFRTHREAAPCFPRDRRFWEAGNRATPISLLICDDAITDAPCFVLPTHLCCGTTASILPGKRHSRGIPARSASRIRRYVTDQRRHLLVTSGRMCTPSKEEVRQGKLLILTQIRYTSRGEKVARTFCSLGRPLTMERRRIRSRFRRDRGT